jgi:hypothetical protein
MILNGAQSALADIHFVVKTNGPKVPGITDIALIAAFGDFYSSISAIWLTATRARHASLGRAI